MKYNESDLAFLQIIFEDAHEKYVHDNPMATSFVIDIDISKYDMKWTPGLGKAMRKWFAKMDELDDDESWLSVNIFVAPETLIFSGYTKGHLYVIKQVNK
jgi:hypothetical protein